jgi:hypothetical protein
MNALRTSRETNARLRALRAAHAVTLGGMIAGAAACNDDVPRAGDEPDNDANTLDTSGGDAALDVATPDAPDTTPMDVMEPMDSIVPDVSEPDTTAPDALDVMEPMDTAPDTERDVMEPMDTAPDTERDVMEPPDTTPDTAIDTTPDTAMDTTPDVAPDTDGAACNAERDDICPENCQAVDDYDCCAAQWGSADGAIPEFCFFEPGIACDCAAVGPFNPPELRI